MAFTLVIKSKGLFGKVKSINMAELLNNCHLKYGSNNEFYILENDFLQSHRESHSSLYYKNKDYARPIIEVPAFLLL